MVQRLAVLFALVLISFSAPAFAGPPEKAGERLELAAEAAALMGYDSSIDAWKASLVTAQDFSQCGCAATAELRDKLKTAWSKAVADEFNSRDVLAGITQALAEELTAAELQQTIDFRKSALGQKVTAAETAKRETAQSAAAEMQEIADMNKLLAARPGRRANLQKVVNLTGGAQAMADAMINISIGTALGASAVAPKDQPRLSQTEIVEMIEQARPQMERSFDVMMVPVYGTLYKPLSDSELKALVKQLKTPAARKFIDVSMRAFNAGMRAQALKMGQRLGRELQAENI